MAMNCVLRQGATTRSLLVKSAIEHVHLFSAQIVGPVAALVDEVGGPVERRTVGRVDRHGDGVGRGAQSEVIGVSVRDDVLPSGAVEGVVRRYPLVLRVVVLVLVTEEAVGRVVVADLRELVVLDGRVDDLSLFCGRRCRVEGGGDYNYALAGLRR